MTCLLMPDSIDVSVDTAALMCLVMLDSDDVPGDT